MPQSYEHVNHPKHYNNYSVEVIDMMVSIEATATWCEMTAFKYHMRVGTKPDNPVEQDLDKERWYLNKVKELRSKLE